MKPKTYDDQERGTKAHQCRQNALNRLIQNVDQKLGDDSIHGYSVQACRKNKIGHEVKTNWDLFFSDKNIMFKN